MNTPNPQTYFQIKANIDALNQAVANQHNEIDGMRRRMAELQTHIDDARALIAREERELSRPKSISRSTLTVDQLIVQKRQLRDLVAEMPILEDVMASLTMQLTGLQNDLENEGRIFANYREELADRLADRMASHILDSTGEAVENLLQALVVARGAHTSDNDAEQKIFFEKMGLRLLTVFCQRSGVKALGVLPGLFDSRQHVENLFHLMETD